MVCAFAGALMACGVLPVELLAGAPEREPETGELGQNTIPADALSRLQSDPRSQGEPQLELLYPASSELIIPADLAPIAFEWQGVGAPRPAAMPAAMPSPEPPKPEKEKASKGADAPIAYELRARGDHADLRLYTAEETASFPRGAWTELLRQHTGGSLQLELRGVRQSGVFVHAKPLTLEIRAALGPGAFFAFSTTTPGITRGELSRTHESVWRAGTAAGGCIGCHAVSRDGRHLLAAVGGSPSLRGWPLGSTGAELSIEAPGAAPGEYVFGSFDQSAARVACVVAGRLSIFNADSGALLGQSPAPLRAAMQAPDWAPDGRALVVVLQGEKPGPDAAKGGSLARVAVALDGSVAEPELLWTAPKDESLWWPSYEPDGAWIAFEKRKGMPREARDAKLFLIRASGGEPIELSELRDKPMSATSAPSFVRGELPERPYVVFSSRRPVGSFMPAEGQRQLFAAALDLTLAAAGKDPSHAAFWLPFQQRTNSYLRAQWAPALQTCTPSDEVCDDADDDCDGQIDEACCSPEPEICGNGDDEDCDGASDEGCHCAFREVCTNQEDDDCDLRVDEQPCNAPSGK